MDINTEIHCTNARQAAALEAVIDERNYQDMKWGPIADRPREVGTYLTLIRAKLRAAETAFATSDYDDDALEELRKVTALGVACLEQHGAIPRTKPNVQAEMNAALRPPSRLAAYTDDALIRLWDNMVGRKLTGIEDIAPNGLRIVISISELESEMTARDISPIPF